MQRRRYAEATQMLQRALDLAGFQDDIAGSLAYAYAASGDLAAARRYVDDLQERRAEGAIGPYALSLAYVGLGDLDRAFELLDQAIDERDMFLPEDFYEPLLDPLRADPRFAQVDERMGIAR